MMSNVINYTKYFYYICDKKDLESIISNKNYFSHKETFFSCNFNIPLFDYYIKKNNINNPYIIIFSRSILNYKNTISSFYKTLHDLVEETNNEKDLFNNTITYNKGEKEIIINRSNDKSIFDTTDSLAELKITRTPKMKKQIINDAVIGYMKYDNNIKLDVNKIILNQTHYEIDKDFDISSIDFTKSYSGKLKKNDCIYNELYGYGYIKSIVKDFISIHFFDYKEENTIKIEFLKYVGELDYDKALIIDQIKHHGYIPKSKDIYFKKMIKFIEKEEKELEDAIDFKNTLDIKDYKERGGK